MKNLKILSLALGALLFAACSKNHNMVPTPTPTAKVVFRTVNKTGFDYKEYYQDVANATNRKGIVILSHGDGGNINDGTLNDQCTALAQEGYIAVTTSYRSLANFGYYEGLVRFKEDMEAVISGTTTTYSIARNKVVIGGISRGGNATLALALPDQKSLVPFAGIKGVILQCPGGDEWQGSAILLPAAYMSSQADPVQGVTDANVFNTGLQKNTNPDVKALSEILVIPGSGHCNNADQYKPFIVKKVKEWLP
jgi:dienelactone hydrolase